MGTKSVMMKRNYSVEEIERMRRAIEDGYPTGRQCSGSERSAEVEDRLRTYMANGTAPEELEQSTSLKIKARILSEMKWCAEQAARRTKSVNGKL